MKPISVLFVSLLCLPAMAQRDYELTLWRNPWLKSGNAAALTTYNDSTIAHATLYYMHDDGRRQTLSDGFAQTLSNGKRQERYGADVQSVFRLSPHIVTYGRAAYQSINVTQATGSMLFPTAQLMPFDLVEDDDSNAGDKRMERFNIDGAIGVQLTRHMALGAQLNYTTGTYAKYRDLRHSNTLMDLDARLNAFLQLPHNSGVGLGLLYRRRTETMRFKTYGTTDRIYTTLVDYANGQGERETFGTEGFTDSKNELPLLSEYVGVAAQGAYNRLFATATYAHRTGYYGRKSQYSASHARHQGDVVALQVRYAVARQPQRLLWMDAQMTTERLTTERENYRRTTATNGTAASYYEYFEPTKMADKAQTDGSLNVNAYWKPATDIFLWHMAGGIGYWVRRQTAYVFTEAHTDTPHVMAPYVLARRGWMSRHRSVWWAQVQGQAFMGSHEGLTAGASLSYEMPLRGTKVRPCLSLNYCFWRVSGATRNSLGLTASATF